MRMLYCLMAVFVTGVYFFGWRVLAIQVVALGAGVITEGITSRQRGKPISTACLVTCLLFGLSLPVTVPYLVVVVGSVVAVLFGKEVFGGFGHNFVNPALLGRAFVYVCFPVDLTGRFVPAFKGFPGGFAHWSFQTLKSLPDYLADTSQGVADAISQASPMWVARDYGVDTASGVAEAAPQAISWVDMLLGSIGGTFHAGNSTVRIMSAGSIGEGCAVVILLAGLYLLITKTVKWRLMLFPLIGIAFANTLWRNVAGYSGLGGVPPLWMNLLGGTTIYVLVFMATEPVSAPKAKLAQVAYGLLIGFLIVTLRWLGVFVAAATFSVLLGNMIAPLLDLGAQAWQDRGKPPTPNNAGGDK